MEKDDYKRKLAAILSADVKGYSRLMGEDEAGTVQTLTKYRATMTSLIRDHRGRLVDSPGDNLLAEFASVVDAVRCAVEVQKQLKARNAKLPEDRKMEFRIGINLGDVIAEGDRIYGDGINIAARIESLAAAGGVCLSRSAYDQVKNKLDLGYEYLGEHAVKNIQEPVRVYRVLMGTEDVGKTIGEQRAGSKSRKTKITIAMAVLMLSGMVVAARHFLSPPPPRTADVAITKTPTVVLPDKPSIAVLPFTNMSEDPKQEYFSDGMTEEIITSLSKIPDLFVIARNSTFIYKGRSVKVQEVGQELGVRYVLEGSVRSSGEKIRVTAQLVDAATGNHLWAERYDRGFKDILVLQDEITLKIVEALQVKLTGVDQDRLGTKAPENMEAYVKCLQGAQYLNQHNREGNNLARTAAKEAIAIDPQYSRGYALLARTHMTDVWYNWSSSPRRSLQRAAKLSRKALSLDEFNANARALLAQVSLLQRRHDEALVEAERAVAVDPNAADSIAQLANVLRYSGRPAEAVALYKKAIRLNPKPPNWYLHQLAFALLSMERFENAIAVCEKLLLRKPDYFAAHAVQAAAYAMLGQDEASRAAAAEALKLKPGFSLEHWARTWPYKNQTDLDFMMGAMRKAGFE